MYANATGAECCAAGNGYWIASDGSQTKVKPKQPYRVDSPTVVSTQTALVTATSTTHSGASASTKPALDSKSGLSSGAKAAIGVGVVLGVLLLVLLAAISVMFRRWKRDQQRLQQLIRNEQKQRGDFKDQLPNPGYPMPIYQLDSRDRPYELEQTAIHRGQRA